ncbi:MAG: TetR/AcrR family transcriptional regulator [Acidimicrobiales bacterium]
MAAKHAAREASPRATAGAPGRRARRGRRSEILAAAAPLFARRGFHGVSVDDLGAATGTSGPALYRHFSSKEEVLAELLLGVSERLLEGGLARVETASSPDDALSALVAFHVDFALRDADVITVQSRDLASLPPEASRKVRALQHRYVSVWASVVDEVTRCGPSRAVAGAHAAFGLMNSTPHSARLPPQEMRSMLCAMALGALGRTPRGS